MLSPFQSGIFRYKTNQTVLKDNAFGAFAQH